MIAQKFKPEIKTLLLDALRSGSYQQGFGRMRIGDCFCAEGVIADLYAKAHGLEWEVMENAEMHIPGITNTVYLNNCVWEWALDIKPDIWGDKSYAMEPKFDVSIGSRGKLYSLMYINDVGKLSFPHIAEVIEKNS